ncbi:MAG: nucleotidyl transferase AbiEii/AbiGii toxin family protein [Candidatus Micrarchaeota archaeon]
MLSLAELKRRASKEGVPAAIVEKDYALSIALGAIADSALFDYLVFKGGTAIRMVYFKEARFSEDLDFTVLKLSRDKVLGGLSKTLSEKTIEGISFQKPVEEKTAAGLKVSIKYTGPLLHAQRILFDFNFRDNLVSAPVKRQLINTYGLSERNITVLGIEELFAEKIHALGNRAAPRDLYDVWFLFGKGVIPDKETVRKKFAYYNEKFDLHNLELMMPKMQTSWHNDLRQVLPSMPSVEQISKEVLDKLRNLHLGDDPVTTETPGVYNPKYS